MSVSEELVRTAYVLFLGREAEDEALVRSLASETSDVQSLRAVFLISHEFRETLYALHPLLPRPEPDGAQ